MDFLGTAKNLENALDRENGEQCLIQLSPRAGCVMSRDKSYRYALSRQWGQSDSPTVCFIGLNPWTADGFTDDATVRRCVLLAKRWGMGGLILVNLFAFRSKNPNDLLVQADPVGRSCNQFIASMTARSSLVVACWGREGAYLDRDMQVTQMIGKRLHMMRVSSDGFPEPPSVIARTPVPFPFPIGSPRYSFALAHPLIPTTNVVVRQSGLK